MSAFVSLKRRAVTDESSQERLPARLHNSRATVMKGSLKPPMMANGKPAPGFPLTRGEFEHITSASTLSSLVFSFSQRLSQRNATTRS